MRRPSAKAYRLVIGYGYGKDHKGGHKSALPPFLLLKPQASTALSVRKPLPINRTRTDLGQLLLEVLELLDDLRLVLGPQVLRLDLACCFGWVVVVDQDSVREANRSIYRSVTSVSGKSRDALIRPSSSVRACAPSSIHAVGIQARTRNHLFPPLPRVNPVMKRCVYANVVCELPKSTPQHHLTTPV